MPLPLFLPCAAGVEELLAQEIARVLPGTPVHSSRGGVALEGEPREVMILNLESRLAQRVLIEVAEGPYHDEGELYDLRTDPDQRHNLWNDAGRTEIRRALVADLYDHLPKRRSPRLERGAPA